MTENNMLPTSNSAASSTESTFSVVPPAARRLRSSQRVDNNEANTAATTPTTGNGAAGSTATASSGLSSIGPIRAKQSRLKGESSSKRKEQNRVAQRAFRKRQKAYFFDLEREVAEKSDKIQVIWKSNAYLVEVMQRLQEENIELKTGRAPNMNFSMDGSKLHRPRSTTPGSTFANAGIDVDTPTLTETLLPNKGKERHVHHPESDEELVSVNDLIPLSGGFGNGMGKQSDSASINSPSPLNHFNSKPLAHHQSQSRLYPQGQAQQGMNFSRPGMTPILKSNFIPPTGQPDLRRASDFSYRSSEGSRASGSVVDSMTELGSPAYSYGVQDQGVDWSSSSAARSGGPRDYDTLVRDLQQIQSEQEEMGSRSSRSSGGPGIVIRDPVQDRHEPELAKEQERVQAQGEEVKTRARRYSEALRKHHAGSLFDPQQQLPQQGYTLPNANPSAELGNMFPWNSQYSQQNQDTGNLGDLAWTDSWKWAQDVSVSQLQGQSENSQQVNQIEQQMQLQRQQPQGQVQQGVPAGNLLNFNMGWVPEGLKSDSNGGLMPFTGVLTPLDGGLGVGVSTDFPWPTYTAHWDVPEKVQAVLQDQNSTAFGHMGSYFVDSPTSSPFAGMM